MNSPQRNLVMLALCLLIQFHHSYGQGLSLQEMLNQHNVNYPSNDHALQPVQSNAGQAAPYPYSPASTDDRLSNLLATNVLQMAHDVGETLLRTRGEKTEVFSPLSIYGALSLLLLGSSGNTYQELLNIMGLSKDRSLINNSWKIHEEFGSLIDDVVQDARNDARVRHQPNWKLYGNLRSNGHNNNDGGDEYKVAVANGVFVQQGFSIRPDYQAAVQSVYKSSMKNLDFAGNGVFATKYINDWVNEKTNGKIPEIVSYFQPETKVVLASALYFKAQWETTFIEGATGPKDFYPDGLGTTPIKVQMMAHGGTFPFYDAVEYDCRILALPYRRNLSTMYIILPNNSNRSRVRQLQSYLTADKIEDMISKMEWKTSIILFPKMHITNKVDLKKTFEQMGLQSLFDERRSDLSLISNGHEVLSGGSYYNLNEQKPIQPLYSQTSSGFATANNVQQPIQPVYSPVSTALSTATQLINGYGGPTASVNEYNKFSAGGYSHVRDDDDDRFLFSRVGEENESADNASTSTAAPKNETAATVDDDKKTERRRRSVTYKVPSVGKSEHTLSFKDYILSKRIVKGNSDKKRLRQRRQIDPAASLKNLDRLRTELTQGLGQNPGLFATEILHKVDLTVNEKGTEGGAATITTLYRTGTDVLFRVETPFIFIVRHDDTKLPLFYGTVVEPTI